MKIVHAGEISVGVYNLGGELYAIEDRCSHDNGPLAEGDFDVDEGYAICPRHGARIDIRTGKALSLPAVSSGRDVSGRRRGRARQGAADLMLDDRVRAVLERLEAEDAAEREAGVAREQRARQVARGDGPVPLLDRRAALGLRGAGDRRLARLLDDLARGGGSLLRRACALPGVRSGQGRGLAAQRGRGGARGDGRAASKATRIETLPQIDDVFDLVFLDAEKEDYEQLFQLARDKVEPGALVVADNVLSHQETLGAYSQARQADPTLESVTVPLDRGLELSVVLR